MKLSTKGRYAMIALTDLAAQGPDRLVIAERDRRAAGHQPRLSRAALRQAAPRGDRRIRCAGPGGGYRLARPVGEIRISEILAAVDEAMDALTRGAGASGGVGRHPGAAARRQALGAAVGERLRDAAPDPARRRGAEPADALPGGAGLRRGGRRGSGCQAAMSARVYLDWNATAPLRPEARAAMAAAMDVGRQPVVGACRGAGGAGDRRAGADAGRRGDRLHGRRRGLHLGRHRGGGAGAGRARVWSGRRSSMNASRPGSSRRCRWMRTGG